MTVGRDADDGLVELHAADEPATDAPLTVRRAPNDRPPIPHRRRVGKYGPVVLMDCRRCHAPFRPDVDVPRDLLCAQCRGGRDAEQPALLEVLDDA
ncbi:hypothetical protein [Nocardia sp. NPDC057455]|uniref:hypothetical protein n=1 Tax=Nocardia sp. NPDC057455 TaxID=3346138 RepID=UPI003671E53B